jgi:hypothetical protein
MLPVLPDGVPSFATAFTATELLVGVGDMAAAVAVIETIVKEAIDADYVDGLKPIDEFQNLSAEVVGLATHRELRGSQSEAGRSYTCLLYRRMEFTNACSVGAFGTVPALPAVGVIEAWALGDCESMEGDALGGAEVVGSRCAANDGGLDEESLSRPGTRLPREPAPFGCGLSHVLLQLERRAAHL